jgi:dihydrofolate synthase / folylpolyglutamate synthase
VSLAHAIRSPVGVLERLYQLAPRGAELGLERMRAACARFGHPEREFETVHVAGTNGKGSVCAMTAAMVSASARLVGLYTSPHLCRFAERIQVDGRNVEQALLARTIGDVLDGAPELTFFEAATLSAFIIFASLDVELAVVEVGLGGRLDATNVLPCPRATAITRIALDHTERLGHTLAAIAREKAGIIKPDVPLVVGPLEPDSMAEVTRIARTMQAPVTFAADDLELRAIVDAHPPALIGAHQIENALVASALAQTLDLGRDAIAAGLGAVCWPGRLEVIATQEGQVLLDAAHNPDGVRTLAGWLEARGAPSGRVALVFGAMADKDYAAMLCSLAPLAAHRVYVAPEGRKAADPAVLARLAPGTPVSSVSEGLRCARDRVGSDGLVVVTGSIYLVGAARADLLGLERDPPVAL